MENQPLPQIVIVSGACCSPNLKKLDQTLEQVLAEALQNFNLSLEIKRESLSHLLHDRGSLTAKQHSQVLALFNNYNTRFTPALFINDDVKFAGKIPTVEQLKSALHTYLDNQATLS